MSKKGKAIGTEVARNVSHEGGSATDCYSYLLSFVKPLHALDT